MLYVFRVMYGVLSVRLACLSGSLIMYVSDNSPFQCSECRMYQVAKLFKGDAHLSPLLSLDSSVKAKDCVNPNGDIATFLARICNGAYSGG